MNNVNILKNLQFFTEQIVGHYKPEMELELEPEQ